MYNQYNNMGYFNTPIKKTINWNNILNNTQKTLGIINQAIPIVYQVKPLLTNAKTLFKVASFLNNTEPSPTKKTNDLEEKDSQGPTFYL